MEKLVDSFKILENEVSLLNFKYSVYKGIFEESEEQIKLLNRVAPISFRFFQDSLMDDIVLSVNRLLDPGKTFGDENLSLSNLLDQAKEKDIDLFGKIEPMIESLRKKYSGLRTHRHKRIVHNDKESMLEEYQNLPPLSKSEVVEAIDEVGDVLRAVSTHLWRQDILFDLTPQAASDAGMLINCLEDGTKS